MDILAGAIGVSTPGVFEPWLEARLVRRRHCGQVDSRYCPLRALGLR
jgi:hypothetical protein